MSRVRFLAEAEAEFLHEVAHYAERQPFFLVYHEEPEGIAVFALVHESRRPGYWASRAR